MSASTSAPPRKRHDETDERSPADEMDQKVAKIIADTAYSHLSGVVDVTSEMGATVLAAVAEFAASAAVKIRCSGDTGTTILSMLPNEVLTNIVAHLNDVDRSRISKTCRTLRNIAANCGICHLNLTADTAKCLAPYLFKPYTFALLRRVFHLTIVVDSARISAKNIIRVLKSVQPHTLTFDQTSWQDREAFDIQAVLNACRVERLRVLDLDGIETISSACMRLVERCAPVLVDLYISTVDCQPLRWLPIGDYSPNMRVLNRMNIFHEVDSKIAAHLGRLISQSSITELTIVPDLDVTDGSTLLRATRGSLQSLNISVWLPEYAQYVPNLKVLKINELSWSSATSPTMPSDLTTLHLGPNGPDQQQQQQMLAKWLQNAAWMPKLSRISADIDFPQRTGLVDAPAETLQAVCVMRGIELSLTVDDDSQIWPMIPGL